MSLGGISSSHSIQSIFKGRLKRSNNVFRRDKGLDIVHSSEDKSTPRSQVVDASPDLVSYLNRGTQRHDVLGIDAAPEANVLAEFLFEPLGIQALVLFEIDISLFVDGRANAAAQVNRNAVRLFVVQGQRGSLSSPHAYPLLPVNLVGAMAKYLPTLASRRA